MISKATTKFIKSLQLKKYRKQERLFVVEGKKSVLEVLKSDFNIRTLLATEDFLSSYTDSWHNIDVHEVSEGLLSSLGGFKTNNSALAVVETKENRSFEIQNGYFLALDNVNDPGNMGTILRVADWYGIAGILASKDTAELYNPKVIAASKGSFCRIQCHYTDLADQLSKTELPVYGAFMHGENVHNVPFTASGIIVVGNEANGISEAITATISHKITIPRYGGAESLNVAMATSIICDNIRRTTS